MSINSINRSLEDFQSKLLEIDSVMQKAYEMLDDFRDYIRDEAEEKGTLDPDEIRKKILKVMHLLEDV